MNFSQWISCFSSVLKISTEVSELIDEYMNTHPGKADDLKKTFEQIVTGKSLFKTIELEVWLKTIGLPFTVQPWQDESAGVIHIIKVPHEKLEPNTMRVITQESGILQFRAPPNTIKTAKKNNRPIADMYVITEPAFHAGINFMDLAFPVFENFFLHKGKRTVIFVPNRTVAEQVRSLLHEEIYGPSMDEILQCGYAHEFAAQLRKEIEYFYIHKNFDPSEPYLELEDYIEVVEFQGDRAVHENLVVQHDPNRLLFTITENGKFIGRVNLEGWEDAFPPSDSSSREPGKEIEFGAYFFDPSTGFDPERLTSSFLVWIGGGDALLVDPLAYFNHYLKDRRIDPSDIRYVLLTHTHSDHDDGLLEEILSGRRVNLITSRLIYNSLLKKMTSVLNMNRDDVAALINFIPTDPGEQIKVTDHIFIEVSYSFHSVPTIAFRISFTGLDGSKKVISYSADTLYDPELYEKLYSENLLSEQRKNDLTGFIWDADLIIHDGGGGLIHTNPEVILKHHEDKKEKVILLHLSEEFQTPGMVRAEKGDELCLVPSRPVDRLRRRIRLLDAVMFLHDVPEQDRMGFLDHARSVRHGRDQMIVPPDGKADKMYIVASGELRIGDSVITKGGHFGAETLFGKELIYPKGVRVQDDAELIILSSDQLGSYKETIRSAWETIGRHRPILDQVAFLKIFPDRELDYLSLFFTECEYKKGDFIVRQGDEGKNFFIIQSGILRVTVKKENEEKYLNDMGPGEPFGEVALIDKVTRTASVRVMSESAIVLALQKKDFINFSSVFPGLQLGLQELIRRRNRDSGH